jgi:hypothetical protein
VPTDWTAHIDAAHRKIAIAEFHWDQLRAALHGARAEHGNRPGIAVQAFFEGVVTAVVSAADQVAQAANSALKLGAGRDGRSLFDVASPEIDVRVTGFKEWRQQPIGVDLRRLRTKMVHYSYEKAPAADRHWHVQPTGVDYAGDRDLLTYASAAVSYAGELGVLADQLQASLAAGESAAS